MVRAPIERPVEQLLRSTTAIPETYGAVLRIADTDHVGGTADSGDGGTVSTPQHRSKNQYIRGVGSAL